MVQQDQLVNKEQLEIPDQQDQWEILDLKVHQEIVLVHQDPLDQQDKLETLVNKELLEPVDLLDRRVPLVQTDNRDLKVLAEELDRVVKLDSLETRVHRDPREQLDRQDLQELQVTV